MKKLNLITTLLAPLIVLMGCKKECTFVYSAWSSCSNSIQIRTDTSSPSGCTGTPPSDSIQRPCVILPSVQIGNQTWTSRNLDVDTYRNGDAIPQVQDIIAWSILTTGAWCYYENNTANGTTYGKLYNWYAVNDTRGLAPNGYHIPTDAEWTILINYLGGTYEAGTKMKNTTGWVSNGNANNTSGFSGLPGGSRGFITGFTGGDQGFRDVDAFGYWWSSSEKYNTPYFYYRSLNAYLTEAYRGSIQGVYGYSVRCLKD